MKLKHRPGLLIFLIPLLLLSVFIARYPTDADTMKVFIHSGTNVLQLIKTFDHFRKDEDERKYQAAHFLIRNMDLHYFREDSLADLKLHWASQHPELKHWEISAIEDSLDLLWASIPDRYPIRKVRDCRGVTADFLISHIEKAFQIWGESPWSDRYNFEEFCEFFLPYKTNLSRPELWMDYYRQQYGWVLDSLGPNPDVIEMIRLVFREIDPKLRWVTMRMGRIANPVEVDTALVGDCEMWADWWGMILRSMGVPAAKIRNPNWGNAELGHFAFVFKDDDGQWIEAETARDNRWIFSVWEMTSAKIWLNTWGKQQESFRYVAEENGLKVKDIPTQLMNWNIRDISKEIIHTTDVEIQFENKPPPYTNFAYLALFDDHSWNPIHWAFIKDNRALFDQMGNDVMYLPVFYEDGKSIPAADPFILSYDGALYPVLPDTNRFVEIELDRVYPVRNSVMNEYCDMMREGTFEASNDSSFLEYEKLHRIDQRPVCNPPFRQKMKGKLSYEMWWQDEPVHPGRKYRYIRFRSDAEKECSIGEIEFYDELDKKLVIQQAYGSGQNPEYVYDGVPGHSYVDEETGSWVAADLGKPREISRIRFIPRDVEPASIHPGERYRLFFWNDGWELVMEIMPTGKSIPCRIHPNGLYLMENLDFDGIFRPFIYRNGKLEWY